MAKKLTAGEIAIGRMVANFEWSLRVLEAGAVPSIVNAEQMASEVKDAIEKRQAERAKQSTVESIVHSEKNRGYDVYVMAKRRGQLRPFGNKV